MDELAHQSHFLVRHNKGLNCKACNVYRADRQFNFWSRTPCVPRPCAADVISRLRNKKRQHRNAATDMSVCGKSSFFTVPVTSTSTRRCEVSVLDPGTPVSLCVRSTIGSSLHSCMPNMPRQFSEYGGSFSASEIAAFSEWHDVHDMRPQVDSDDPNGPRASLRSNFDDPDGREPTECPGDHFSFPTSVDGQTGEVVACRPTIQCGMFGVHWILSARCGGIWVPRLEAATCWICGEAYPRPGASLPDSLPASGVKRKRHSNQVASPSMSRDSSRVSESDSPCDQSAVGVQSVQPVNEGIPVTLRAPVRPAIRICPSSQLVHVVPRRSKSSIRVARKYPCALGGWIRSPLHHELAPRCLDTFQPTVVNPTRTREPNGKLNVNCWLNLKSATKPLNKYYGAKQPAPTRLFLVSYTSATSSLSLSLSLSWPRQ